MRHVLILPAWLLVFSFVCSNAEILHVGIHQIILNDSVPKKDLTIATTVFMKEFTASEGIETTITYYDDPKKLGEDFNSGKIDYVVADALTIIRYIPINNLINGVMTFKKNKADSQTLLILGLSDDPRPLREKLGGAVASDGDACSELYLRTRMLQNGLPDNPDFIPTRNPQQSLLKLFFKKADLAIMDRASYEIAAELNPQLRQRTTVLESVPLTIGPITYMRKGLSPLTQKKIIALGKQLDTTTRGKQMLQLFRASSMDDSSIKDLENVYALYKKYENLAREKHR